MNQLHHSRRDRGQASFGIVIAITIAVIVVILLLITVFSLNRQRTASNEWGCKFGSGMIEQSKALKKALGPGETDGYGNDKIVTGPADIRFYYIDNDPATADFGSRPIVVPAKGSSTEGVGVVNTSTEVQVRFVLNENFCDLFVGSLKRINDSTPLNYNAKQDEASGWATFLNQSMNQKLIEATRPVLRDVDYITLYTNAKISVDQVDDPATPNVDESELPPVTGSAYDVLAKTLSENLTAALGADLGKDYFCGPSYKFDGTIDGQFEGGGCPPLEVTVKSITPTNAELIANLEAIVTNEEQQRKIASDTRLKNEQARAASDQAIAAAQAESDRAIAAAAAEQERAIAQAEADRATKLAQAQTAQDIQVAEAEAQQAIQLAQETQRRTVAEAKAASDLAIALARAEVSAQEAANTTVSEQAKAAYCIALAQAGIRCDLLASAQAGSNIVPNFNLSGTSGGDGATVVLDARP